LHRPPLSAETRLARMNDNQVLRRVVIRGRVQGVGYRAWLEDVALARGLEGWVRNRRDGTVEALFSGSPETVGAMLNECRRGPPTARVAEVQEDGGDAALLQQRRSGERFSVLPTV
jgi:acylphosphatase